MSDHSYPPEETNPYNHRPGRSGYNHHCSNNRNRTDRRPDNWHRSFFWKTSAHLPAKTTGFSHPANNGKNRIIPASRNHHTAYKNNRYRKHTRNLPAKYLYIFPRLNDRKRIRSGTIPELESTNNFSYNRFCVLLNITKLEGFSSIHGVPDKLF